MAFTTWPSIQLLQESKIHSNRLILNWTDPFTILIRLNFTRCLEEFASGYRNLQWRSSLIIENRELKQRRRRRRRGRRLAKKEFIFCKRNSRLSRSVRYANGSENVLKLHMQRRRSIPNGNTKNYPASSTFRRHRKTWSFHVVVLQRTAKKCTKNYNAYAQLYCFAY